VNVLVFQTWAVVCPVNGLWVAAISLPFDLPVSCCLTRRSKLQQNRQRWDFIIGTSCTLKVSKHVSRLFILYVDRFTTEYPPSFIPVVGWYFIRLCVTGLRGSNTMTVHPLNNKIINMQHWCNVNERKSLCTYRKKNLSQFHFVLHKSHADWFSIEPEFS